MNVKEALRLSIDMGETVCMRYLDDLSDEELMRRPAPGANHINWQVGHLIVSEYQTMNIAVPGNQPALPEGFAETYSKENCHVDDPAAFRSKAELMDVFKQQRSATLRALEATSDEQFDQPTGIPYAPTVGAVFSLQGGHWLMHAGQWAVIRRQLGRLPVI